MGDLAIIVPAFNEEEALRCFLQELLEFCNKNDYQLVVVNDGSTDGTRKLLDKYNTDPCLTVIHSKVNKGYGGAIKAGIEKATTAYVVTIDADRQHYLSDIDKLYKTIIGNEADMVVGRRCGLVEHGYRKAGKKLIRFIARLLMPIDIKDLNSGMKIYDRRLASKYIKLCPDSMAYSDIITLIFINQKHLVLERDIKIRKREMGISTINTKTAFDTVMEILNVVIFFSPMRIFLPIAALSLLAGGVWGVPIVLRGEGVSVGTLLLVIAGLLFFLLGLIAEQLSLIRKERIK